ncbi:uncharacterized protein PG986_011234 [Apiospora aurea]|uniref:RING-type domain-containing protein n=1 Tax=Apiospora aurea TaxID=335848 RepID=A0ABR1Q5U3_9PEZI
MPSSETHSIFTTTWWANRLHDTVGRVLLCTQCRVSECRPRLPRTGCVFSIPVIAKLLEKAGQQGEPLLHSECPNCHRTLSISSCVADMVKEECDLAGGPTAAKSKLEFYEKHDIEHTVVLRCGHLIGAECLRDAAALYASGQPSDFCPDKCCTSEAKATCDGCDSNLLADASFDPFVKPTAWPLGESDQFLYQPWAAFQKVGLTQAEKDPDAKRYCQRCVYYQIMRKFSEVALTFPSCDQFASAEDCATTSWKPSWGPTAAPPGLEAQGEAATPGRGDFVQDARALGPQVLAVLQYDAHRVVQRRGGRGENGASSSGGFRLLPNLAWDPDLPECEHHGFLKVVGGDSLIDAMRRINPLVNRGSKLLKVVDNCDTWYYPMNAQAGTNAVAAPAPNPWEIMTPDMMKKLWGDVVRPAANYAWEVARGHAWQNEWWDGFEEEWGYYRMDEGEVDRNLRRMRCMRRK